MKSLIMTLMHGEEVLEGVEIKDNGEENEDTLIEETSGKKYGLEESFVDVEEGFYRQYLEKVLLNEYLHIVIKSKFYEEE